MNCKEIQLATLKDSFFEREISDRAFVNKY